MSGNQESEGYDAAVYYTPEANTQNAQLIVSKVGADTNWKMCLDTSLEADAEAKVGVENQDWLILLYTVFVTGFIFIFPGTH